ARRNMDLTVILYNNHIYGMTGGQCSPTTPWGAWATTAPHRNVDHAFDISALVAAAGASFVARSTVYHAAALQKYIRQALEHGGFSLVEAMTPCPTAYGRKNSLKTPVAMMEDLKRRAVPIGSVDPANPPSVDDAILTGVIADRQKPEYAAEYLALIERLRSGK
ncbi:MAG: 2-oxoacid:ferredoxin oxidoreductase subunit beta, partial [Deltaproteobacteria bacterium]|nr:2-oxoacid:ferredoxin oxidoreductase subunit beta [Deltaproteobacteria bacterium]